jgi:hypothetical protein
MAAAPAAAASPGVGFKRARSEAGEDYTDRPELELRRARVSRLLFGDSHDLVRTMPLMPFDGCDSSVVVDGRIKVIKFTINDIRKPTNLLVG